MRAALWQSAVTAILVLCLAAGPVYAGCSTPGGNEGDMIYNHDFHTMQFCNGSNWVAMSGLGLSGPFVTISTQTASGSASLQFTSLPSYNTLFLNCQGIQPATNGVTFEMQFGEGATPTWKTASYTYDEISDCQGCGGTGTFESASASFIPLSFTNDVGNAAAYNLTTQLYISSTASSTIYKSVQGHVSYINKAAGANEQNWLDQANYIGDTNPITAIKVFFSSGNIAAGTCSLYGMP